MKMLQKSINLNTRFLLFESHTIENLWLNNQTIADEAEWNSKIEESLTAWAA